jgi:2-hydroxy-6-oxonona-2,4-dienedioate hydrolase
MKELFDIDNLVAAGANFKESRVHVHGQEVFSLVSAKPTNNLPIIMIHGAIVSHVYFMPTAAILAESYPILVPDLPGHGGSSKPEHALPVPKQARILRAWLNKLEIRKAVIMANSYGCEIAVEFALEFPEVVDRLILISPSSDPHEPNLFRQFIRLMTDGLYERPMMFLVLVRDLLFMGLPRAFETAGIMLKFDYGAKLPLINIPTLVINGQNDPLAPPLWAKEVVKTLPMAKLITIANGPHNVQFSNPKDVAAAVTEFLAGS